MTDQTTPADRLDPRYGYDGLTEYASHARGERGSLFERMSRLLR